MSHPYLEKDEKVQVIWLDDQYLLLHFNSSNSCKRFREAWEGRSQIREEARKKLLMEITVLPYDVYEELCGYTGRKVSRGNESLSSGKNDSCLPQSKIVRLNTPSEVHSRYCVFM